MTLFVLMSKFIKFANLTIRSIQMAIQLLQVMVLIAVAIFHAFSRNRHAAV